MRRFAIAFVLVACAARAGADDKTPPVHFDCGGHSYGPTVWRATADGKTLVTLGDENSIRVWDAATGKLARTLWLPPAAGGKNTGPKLWLAPDGKRAAVPYHTPEEPRGKLALIPLDDSGTYRVIGGEPFEVTEVAFSANGKLVATTAGRPSVNVWDAATGKRAAVLNFDPDLRATGFAFSPDGKKVAIGLPMVNFNELKRSVIAIYEAETGKWESQFAYPRDGFPRPEWSPDGKLLLAANNGFAFDVFTTKGERKVQFDWKPGGRLVAAGFDTAGRCVSVAHTDTGLRVRDELAGRGLFEVRDDTAGAWRAAVLAGGTVLLRTNPYRVGFRLLDAGTGKELSRVSAHSFTRFSGLAWAKTGSVLAWADSDRPYDNADVKPGAALDLAALAPPAKVPEVRSRALEWGNVTLKQGDYSASTTVMGKPVKLAYEAEYDFETIVHGTLVGQKHAVLACTTGLFGYDAETGAQTTNYKPFTHAYKVSPSPDGRHFAAAAHLHPVISVFRVGVPDPVLFVAPRGAEWVAWTPTGAWFSSEGGTKLAGKLEERAPGKLPTFVPFDPKLKDADKVKAAVR